MLTQIAITVSVLISFGADDGDEPETRHQDRGDKDDEIYDEAMMERRCSYRDNSTVRYRTIRASYSANMLFLYHRRRCTLSSSVRTMT